MDKKTSRSEISDVSSNFFTDLMHGKKHSEYYTNKIAKKHQFDQLRANTEKIKLYHSSVHRDNLYYAERQFMITDTYTKIHPH